MIDPATAPVPSATPECSDLPFDASLRDRWTEGADGWHYDMPAGWSQGRSVYGGLVAASAAGLARLHVDAERELRMMSLQLYRPTADGRVDGTVRVVREGKYASFVDVALSQDGSQNAAASFVFARNRPASTAIPAAPPWEGPDPDSLVEMPYIPGVVPEFVRNLSFRWVRGGMPFTGADETEFDAYCRFRAPAGDIEGVLGLLDAFPAPALSTLTSPAPASTVSWTAHVVAAPERIEGWCKFTYRTVVGAGGMHTVFGSLYSEDGRLLGWTEQLVAVYG